MLGRRYASQKTNLKNVSAIVWLATIADERLEDVERTVSELGTAISYVVCFLSCGGVFKRTFIY